MKQEQEDVKQELRRNTGYEEQEKQQNKAEGKKNSNEKDLIEKFSQKEVGKDNLKEYL